MKNLLDYDGDESILAAMREMTDRELRWYLVNFLDLRNHAEPGWAAEQWNDLLCLAARVRDERRMLARAADDAVNPFKTAGLV